MAGPNFFALSTMGREAEKNPWSSVTQFRSHMQSGGGTHCCGHLYKVNHKVKLSTQVSGSEWWRGRALRSYELSFICMWHCDNKVNKKVGGVGLEVRLGYKIETHRSFCSLLHTSPTLNLRCLSACCGHCFQTLCVPTVLCGRVTSPAPVPTVSVPRELLEHQKQREEHRQMLKGQLLTLMAVTGLLSESIMGQLQLGQMWSLPLPESSALCPVACGRLRSSQ
jgi:hypothetical protein